MKTPTPYLNTLTRLPRPRVLPCDLCGRGTGTSTLSVRRNGAQVCPLCREYLEQHRTCPEMIARVREEMAQERRAEARMEEAYSRAAEDPEAPDDPPLQADAAVRATSGQDGALPPPPLFFPPHLSDGEIACRCERLKLSRENGMGWRNENPLPFESAPSAERTFYGCASGLLPVALLWAVLFKALGWW